MSIENSGMSSANTIYFHYKLLVPKIIKKNKIGLLRVHEIIVHVRVHAQRKMWNSRHGQNSFHHLKFCKYKTLTFFLNYNCTKLTVRFYSYNINLLILGISLQVMWDHPLHDIHWWSFLIIPLDKIFSVTCWLIGT